MRETKEALSRLVSDLDAGHAPKIARKTILTPREDGSWLRRITLADGSVIKEEVIAAEQCFALAARAKTGLSQSRFAALLGISVRTRHDWEQGRRAPSGAARTLLTIALRHPEILRDLPPS